MTHAKTQRWFAGFAIAILITAGTAVHSSEKKVHEKHDASALNTSLRDVIDVGVKIFNDHGDHAGCYRLYQGALLSVRPFLASDLQKTVDDGFTNADKLGSYADRAFELRKVIDTIRTSAKSGPKFIEDKGEPKTEAKAAKDKEKKDESPKEAGLVSGIVTFDGKPLDAKYSVTLVDKAGKEHRAAIQGKKGEFQFANPIPEGVYRVAIAPAKDASAIPARYKSAKESGIEITVQKGKQTVSLNLVP
jgi:hypothetical protein